MPSLDSDSFIKINCDWWGTCNRLFPTTKQIIDDSLSLVTDYCWVYFGVRMFCIGVVIVMLSSDLAWMYALITKVITNHNMWFIFSTNVSLRLQSYFRLFLLHGHLKVIGAMNIWTRYIGGYIQECTVLCVKALDSLCTFSISRGHFFSFKWHLNLTTKTAHTGGKLGVFWGFELFLIIFFVRVISKTALNWSIVVQSCHRCHIFYWMWTSISLFFNSR